MSLDRSDTESDSARSIPSYSHAMCKVASSAHAWNVCTGQDVQNNHHYLSGLATYGTKGFGTMTRNPSAPKNMSVDACQRICSI